MVQEKDYFHTRTALFPPETGLYSRACRIWHGYWDRSRMNRRYCMHYLTIVFIIWAVAATVLLALLAYRSTLTRYEEDCLFLGDCNDHQHKEQESILARVRKVQPAVRFMTVATCIMSAALVGTFLFQLVQQLNAPAS